MKQNLKIGIVPMTSTDSVEVNLRSILAQLKNLEVHNLELICFPENSLYFNFHKNLNQEHALDLHHSCWQTLQSWVDLNNCHLHMGGIPLRDGANVYNATVLLSPQKKPQIVYRKIHLFDVNVQGREFRESLSVSAGKEPAVIEVNGWKLGLSICYDLRFSELFVKYHQQEVDLILVPSSFLVPTGRSHWQTLLRARAIETQAFVAAPAQVGTHASELDPGLGKKETWGESLLIGPWGEIFAASPSFDQSSTENLLALLVYELDASLLQKVRAQIPLLSHRRL